MSEKAENVQRKTLKDLQKAGELLIRTTLKKTGQSERNEAGSGVCNETNSHCFAF